MLRIICRNQGLLRTGIISAGSPILRGKTDQSRRGRKAKSKKNRGALSTAVRGLSERLFPLGGGLPIPSCRVRSPRVRLPLRPGPPPPTFSSLVAEATTIVSAGSSRIFTLSEMTTSRTWMAGADLSQTGDVYHDPRRQVLRHALDLQLVQNGDDDGVERLDRRSRAGQFDAHLGGDLLGHRDDLEVHVQQAVLEIIPLLFPHQRRVLLCRPDRSLPGWTKSGGTASASPRGRPA